MKSIPFGRPIIGKEEKEAVLSVLSGDVLTHGPQAPEFEKEFSEFIGSNINAITVSSGMAALHLAFWQLGIGPGDEVIVPAQTHVATVHAVEIVGAKPVFADCELSTGNVTANEILRLITRKTKAIAIVHFLGIPCDMPKIMEVADRYNLYVIEDCALALGTRINGQHVGTFGHAGIFSFYPVKHITTGDGGMFVSKLSELSEKVRKSRAFGVDRSFSERTVPGFYDVPTIGLNYRMSDINAVIGRVQLSRIKQILEKRRLNFLRLKDNLNDKFNLAVLDSTSSGHANSHYCLTIILDDAIAQRRVEIMDDLKKLGIGTSIYYPHPIPRLAYYNQKYRIKILDFPNALKISDQSIALPIGPHVESEDVDYIASHVKEIVRKYS
jgi:perosamine synthetase